MEWILFAAPIPGLLEIAPTGGIGSILAATATLLVLALAGRVVVTEPFKRAAERLTRVEQPSERTA